MAITEAPGEQGITVISKADAERMAERRKPWTFVATRASLRDEYGDGSDRMTEEIATRREALPWIAALPAEDVEMLRTGRNWPPRPPWVTPPRSRFCSPSGATPQRSTRTRCCSRS
ncbi:hypothetical protein ACFYNO_24325 [Kitasatospora sp. NPDC006697]|uniref:hypothetical protein n=1 Tax=Kitasatospora sp. NPDC006697 TaxID=3364020 RepID=UPI0036990886